MRSRITLIWLGATAVVASVVGFIAYQAGWAAGLATRLPQGTAGPYPYFGPPHFFGFFGPLPFILLLVVLLLVFRGGRRWGPWGPWGGYRWSPPGTPPPPRPDEDPWKDWPQRPDRPERTEHPEREQAAQ